MQNNVYKFELQRKIFHLYSLIFPVLYLFTPKIFMSIFLSVITAFTLYVDISKHYNNKIKGFVEKYFAKYLRGKEKIGSFTLSGASYMAVGFFITCLFFSKGLAIASWLILIISDSIAALVGIKYGKPFNSNYNNKTLAGSIAFFVSSLFISIVSYFFFVYQTSFLIIFFSSAAATLTEFYSSSIKIDDNLSIPLVYCLSTVVLNLMSKIL